MSKIFANGEELAKNKDLIDFKKQIMPESSQYGLDSNSDLNEDFSGVKFTVSKPKNAPSWITYNAAYYEFHIDDWNKIQFAFDSQGHIGFRVYNGIAVNNGPGWAPWQQIGGVKPHYRLYYAASVKEVA